MCVLNAYPFFWERSIKTYLSDFSKIEVPGSHEMLLLYFDSWLLDIKLKNLKSYM